MHCSTAAGQQRAAQDALSVSEHELQRIKQQGCFTTAQDRAIMRNPDYRALPYHALANPILALEFDTNNKYTAINQAEGFTSPFVDGVTNQVVQVRPTVPGLSMAGTGDLAAISGALLSSDEDDKRQIYRRIADSIRGAPPKVSEESPTRQGASEAALKEMAVRESLAAQMQPITDAADVTAQAIYGQRAPDLQKSGLLEQCKQRCRAALYDLMHYDSILEEQLHEAKCSSRLGYALTREGRLPYLLLVLTGFFLFLYVAFLLMRR
jgi:hypothetical protein